MQIDQLKFDIPVANVEEDPNPMVQLLGIYGQGKRCRTCRHLVCVEYTNRYYKCELRRNTRGKATDMRVSWNACKKYEE